MNELHFAYKVRQHLNRGLHELRPETAARLAASRESALSCQRQAVRQSALVTAGHFAQHYYDGLRVKQILAAFFLLVFLAVSAFWIADQRVSEIGAIDSALLADDLPIGAFTDKGFAAWLRSSSPD